MTAVMTLEEFRNSKGEEIGVSSWIEVGQDRIDGFADLVGDRNFIHVDPVRAAAETDLGGTIAHGFLTLSLLPSMVEDCLPRIAGTRMGVLYGFDRIRFIAPVPSGARIRGRFVLAEVEERRPGEVTVAYDVTVEIEGRERPALAAVWLTRRFL